MSSISCILGYPNNELFIVYLSGKYTTSSHFAYMFNKRLIILTCVITSVHWVIRFILAFFNAPIDCVDNSWKCNHKVSPIECELVAVQILALKDIRFEWPFALSNHLLLTVFLYTLDIFCLLWTATCLLQHIYYYLNFGLNYRIKLRLLT